MVPEYPLSLNITSNLGIVCMPLRFLCCRLSRYDVKELIASLSTWASLDSHRVFLSHASVHAGHVGFFLSTLELPGFDLFPLHLYHPGFLALLLAEYRYQLNTRHPTSR